MTASPRPTPASTRATGPGRPTPSRFAPVVEERPKGLQSPKPLAMLLPRLRPYAGRLVLSALCLLVAAGVGLAFPAIVRYLLDAAFERGDREQLDDIALLLLGLFALQGVMNFVQVYLLSSTTERVIAKLREDLFAHLVRLSPGFFTERRTGELTSRLSADLGVLQALLATNLSDLARRLRHELSRTDLHLDAPGLQDSLRVAGSRHEPAGAPHALL